VKQKNNIFEELNKMKNLIKAKPGTVISEQEIQEFGGPSAAALKLAGVRDPESTKAINATFCNVRGGKISSGFFQGQPWSNYKTKYSVTTAEETEAQKSCPTVKTGIVAGSSNKGNDYARIVGDSSKKIQSTLGMSPTGQLSDDDLQKIIGLLNGEVSGEVNQTTKDLPKTADGQIDVEKMIELLK
jgi:hypothetical protein